MHDKVERHHKASQSPALPAPAASKSPLPFLHSSPENANGEPNDLPAQTRTVLHWGILEFMYMNLHDDCYFAFISCYFYSICSDMLIYFELF